MITVNKSNKREIVGFIIDEMKQNTRIRPNHFRVKIDDNLFLNYTEDILIRGKINENVHCVRIKVFSNDRMHTLLEVKVNNGQTPIGVVKNGRYEYVCRNLDDVLFHIRAFKQYNFIQ
jgi:hypothetical protein